jgi:hypothetical protein
MALSPASAQWSETQDRGAATSVSVGYWVLNGDGSYSVDTAGPADAYLTESSGTHFVDPSATSGSPVRVMGTVAILADAFLAGVIVQNGDSTHSFAAVGTAAAYLTENADGTYSADTAATSGERIPVYGSTASLA